jgi:ABC-2 type transport system ATP-binding protein
MTDAIETHELVKTYPPDVTALRGLSFSVPTGTIFGLLGPNGAGKSTTVKILTTLSKPDSGTARVAGFDVVAEPQRVRHAIGVVGQKHGADPDATGRENLTLQGEFYGITGAELRRRVNESLRRFGLADAGDRQAKTYSGGMQRRLDVAMGLLHRPRALFLDEPTTGLDPEARAEMWREIERLAREEEMTILLTTHYLEEADKLAASLAIVDRGQIVAQGAPEQLKGELQGDAIALELTEVPANGSALRALEDVSDVREVTLEGRALHARVANGAGALPAVIAALETNGLAVATATIARPSLDDVYLRHAGRAWQQTDSQEVAA